MRRLNEYIGKSVKVLSTETKTYTQKGVIGKSGVVFQVKNGSNKIGVLIEHNKNKEIFWFSENELEINNRYDRNEFCKVAIIEMFKGEEIGVAINSEFYYQLKEFYQKHDKVLCDDVIIMFERFGYRVCNHLGFLKGIVDVNYYDKKIEGNAIRITLEEDIANDLRHVSDINDDKNEFKLYEENRSSDGFIFTHKFFLENCNKDKFENNIENLNDLLKKLGVNFQLKKEIDGYNTLNIDVDGYRVKQVTEHQTRNAGRKKKDGTKILESMPLEEFTEKFNRLGATKLAKEYDVNRRTIYRYLNNAKLLEGSETI